MKQKILVVYIWILSIIILSSTTLAINPYTNITATYNFDSTTNASYGEYTSINYGNPTLTIGKIGNALNLTGKNYINTQFSPKATDTNFSFNTWIYPTKLDTTSEVIISSDDGSCGYIMVTGSTGGNYNTTQITLNRGCQAVWTTNNSIKKNTWTMLTVVGQKNETKAYINGVLNSINTAMNYSMTGRKNWSIGSNAGLGANYSGLIDMPTFYNRTLTDTEITTLYNAGAGLQYNQNFTIVAQNIFSNQITTFSANVNNTIYNTTTGQIITGINTSQIMNITVTANGYYTATYNNYNTTDNLVVTLNATNWDSKLTITSNINGFTTNIINPARTYTYNTTNTSIDTYIMKGEYYNIIFIPTNTSQAIQNATNYYMTNTTQTLNFNTIIGNSIFITWFNETSGTKITNKTTTLTLTNINTSSITTTTITGANGTYNYTSLTPATYKINIDPDGFSARNYYVTVNDRSYQYLNAYILDDSLSNNMGYYVRSNTGNALKDVSLAIYKYINGTFEICGQDKTDILGFVQFAQQDATTYKYILTTTGYTLNPFTFTPYTINSPYTFTMNSEIETEFINVFDDVKVSFSQSNSSIPQNSIYNIYYYTTSATGSLIYTNMTCNNNNQISLIPAGALLNTTINTTGITQFNCIFAFKSTLIDSEYSWNTTYRTIDTSNINVSIDTTLKDIKKSINNTGWTTILAYIIIILSCVVVHSLRPDPRLIGFTALIGIIIFVSVGWIDYIMGGVVATIGLLLLFMGSR